MDETVVKDAEAWRAWLDEHEDASDGVWLVLAKKGTITPTSLTYAQALDEALCSGWIDGQKGPRDVATFLQRFTPRRSGSVWSERNTGLVEALITQGRMRPRGQAEVDRAKADGRWDRAYAGAATAVVPDDLAAALTASPAAAELFARLTAVNRYAVIHRVTTASPAARAGRIATLVGRLAEGRTPYPQ
jgi:uncharacterized protein YdeI (YjbR/CyaY-like superfamily)